MKKTIKAIAAFIFIGSITTGAFCAPSIVPLNESKTVITTTTTTTTIVEDDDDDEKTKTQANTYSTGKKPVPSSSSKSSNTKSSNAKSSNTKTSTTKNSSSKSSNSKTKKSGPKPVDGYDYDFEFDYARRTRDGHIEIHTTSGKVIRISSDDIWLLIEMLL